MLTAISLSAFLSVPHIALLFLYKALAVALEPEIEFLSCLFQLIAIQESATKRFEKCAGSDVVSELLISLVFRALSD
jgi:hypothetical protein